MDQQQRQVATLQHEIRLLEKQKEELLYDIERMAAAKKEEYRQYKEQIGDLTQRRDDLQKQVERLREGIGLLTSAYMEAKTFLEKIQKEGLQKA